MVAGIIFWVCQSVSKTKNEYKKNIGSAHTQKCIIMVFQKNMVSQAVKQL